LVEYEYRPDGQKRALKWWRLDEVREALPGPDSETDTPDEDAPW
jgi:hypothetical protein